MVYADTDFFLALLKEKDWLQKSAIGLLEKYKGQLWTSPAALMELLLLSKRHEIDPEKLLTSGLEIAELRGGEPWAFLAAAHYMKERGIGAFDALHAAFCGKDSEMISSDSVFDKLGLKRIPLEAPAGSSAA